MRTLENQKVVGRKSKVRKVLENALIYSTVFIILFGCLYFFGYQFLNKIS